MRLNLLCFLFLISVTLFAQNEQTSPFDGDHWGVVLEHPDTKKVVVQKDVMYFKGGNSTLHMDVYLPPGIKKGEKRPAIIFLNGIGDEEGQSKLKSWGIYSTWPKLVAAYGYVGVTMESDGSRIQECFDGLFSYLNDHGSEYNIDANRLGVYAASANGRESSSYLMKQSAFPGIKAAAFYYPEVPKGPYRKDLPVLFIVAEKDIHGDNYSRLWAEVLKNKSPWTIKLATGLPHAFDAFSDNDEAKKAILETLSFWKNHLDPVPASSAPPSMSREIIATQYEGDYPKIIRLMKEWMKENPNSKDVAAFYVYANALMRTNEFAEAETIFKKCIALDPNKRGTYLSMTVISYALNKPKEAEINLAKYEKDTTPEGFTYGYIANSLLGIKKYAIAAQYYEKTLTFHPRPVDFYNLACCYALTGEKDKAFVNLAKAADNGFKSKQHYESDTDLASLRTDQRWNELVKKLE